MTPKTFYAVFIKHKYNGYYYNFNADALYLDKFGESQLPNLSVSETYAKQIYNYSPSDRTFYKVYFEGFSGEDTC